MSKILNMSVVFSTFSLRRQLSLHFRNISITMFYISFKGKMIAKNNLLHEVFLSRGWGQRWEERLHQGSMAGLKTVAQSDFCEAFWGPKFFWHWSKAINLLLLKCTSRKYRKHCTLCQRIQGLSANRLEAEDAILDLESRPGEYNTALLGVLSLGRKWQEAHYRGNLVGGPESFHSESSSSKQSSQ